MLCTYMCAVYFHPLTFSLSQDSLESLMRTQLRVLEGQLYNKSNELQEDICMKKFDLHAKKMHLAAIRAQVSTRIYKYMVVVFDLFIFWLDSQICEFHTRKYMYLHFQPKQTIAI